MPEADLLSGGRRRPRTEDGSILLSYADQRPSETAVFHRISDNRHGLTRHEGFSLDPRAQQGRDTAAIRTNRGAQSATNKADICGQTLGGKNSNYPCAEIDLNNKNDHIHCK